MNSENNNSEQNDDPSDLRPKLRTAFALISALCDEQITPAQFAELESLVCNDDEVAKFYVQMMHLNVSLRHFSSYFAPKMFGDQEFNAAVDDADHSLAMDESIVLPAIRDQQSPDEEELQERFQPAPTTLKDSTSSSIKSFSTIVKSSIAALFILAVGIAGYVFVSNHSSARRGLDGGNSNLPPTGPVAAASQPHLLPAPDPIATMNFTEKPVWSAGFTPPLDGNFFPNQTLSIASGDVQFSFHTRGQLVVEGPAEVVFVAQDKVDLHLGKIAATVPGGGLVVDCPHGSVTDLGTQFGVEVQPDGATEIAVFKGSVSAILNSTATTQGTRQLLLTAGQAAAMAPNALKLEQKGAMPQRFVRSLVNGDISSLDVPDLICGGDGTTRKRGIGIDPSSGMVGNLRPVAAINSDGKFHHATNGSPFIDGALIADATKGEMIVDSAGDRFHFTGIGSTSYNYIFTGGKIPWPVKPEPDNILDNIDYSTPEHSIICIHPNNAITLDLNAVRRIYPDRALKTFHCRVGISGARNPKSPKIPDAAVLVLVDGAMRFQNPHFTILDGSFDVDVPIKETDRFMTLASTYAGTGNHANWVLWVDAKLDLAAGR